MLAENKATIKNKAGGKITGFGENNVGMYSKGTDITKETATNEGTVDMQNKGSAGMFGQDTTILNKGKVNVVGNSAAMYASDANAINEKTIDVKGENSAGVLEEISEQNIEIEGKNTETGTITVTGDNSAGMYGKEQEQNYASNKDPKLTLTNKGKIDIKSKSSAGMLVENKNGTLKKENMKAINKGEINLAVDKEKNVGMSANNAIAENENKISISSKKSTGMFTQNNGTITNRGNISSTGEENIGMVAKDAGSEAINEGEISLEGKSSLGMVASESGKVLNKKNITTKGEHSLGMYIRENSTGENTADGVISLLEKESVGMYAENNGSADTAKNSGTINLGANGATSKSLIGMYAKAEAGKKAGVKNSGTINVNTKESVGMYAENGNADVDDVELVNEKEINVNAENSVGIFAKKAKVSKVGKIKLGDSAEIGGNISAHRVRDLTGFGIDGALSLKVRAEFTHAQHNAVSNADRVNIASINITQIIHDRLEPAFLLHPAAEVEVAQPLHARFFAAGNAVKVFFHLRSELVVHVGAKTGFEQAHHRERGPRRHERTGTHLHIAAIHNR